MSSNYVPPEGLTAPDAIALSADHQTPTNAASPSPVVVIGGPSQHQDSNHYVNMEAGDGFGDGLMKDDELGDGSGSHVSSILTAEGIHDMTGFTIVCFVILVGDMSRGVMFPTLWPLVDLLGGTTVTLGFAVAAFSFGRVVVSPLFGSWSVIYGYKNVLLMSISLLLSGTLVYAQAQNVGTPGFLIFAQSLLGVGSGTLGVTRAYIAEITATRARTRYMAWITAVQYAGFTVTPFFGALFIKILGDNDYQWGLLRLNMYTAPAYFMGFICFSTFIALVTCFQDRQRLATQKDKKKSKRRSAIDEVANRTTLIGLTTYDACILGCMLLNIATKGSIGSFETVGVNYAETFFDISPASVGTYVGSCGTIGVFALLSMGVFSVYATDVQLICGGMAVMVVGILSLAFVPEDPDNNPSWRYLFAIFMVYSIGYPIGHTAVIGLFSKIVGRRPQGTLMGWFASAGSIARITFPVMAGFVAAGNIRNLFVILASVLTVSAFFVLMSRKTLTLLSS
jgi:ceroid-lipofuscinosis MFS transporter 7